MLKFEVYRKPVCVKCDFTYRQLKNGGANVKEIPLSPEIVHYMKKIGYRSAPLVRVYEDGELIKEWSDLKPDLINLFLDNV